MKRMWFHSLDGGPWERIDFPRSTPVLASHLAEDDIYDDGVGNRYYWTRDLGDPVLADQAELARGIGTACLVLGALLLVVALVVIL